MREITCYCGTKFEADIPDRVDLDLAPETANRILEGKFLSVSCPFCGKELKPEFPVTIVFHDGVETLSFLPELSRNHFLSGREPSSATEVVIGYPELAEWVRIREAGLSREVVEILKYHYLRRADHPGNLSMYFSGKEQEKLGFHIHGLKEGEIGVSRIPMSVYETVAADIQRLREEEPLRGFLAKPYVSVNNISWEENR